MKPGAKDPGTWAGTSPVRAWSSFPGTTTCPGKGIPGRCWIRPGASWRVYEAGSSPTGSSPRSSSPTLGTGCSAGTVASCRRTSPASADTRLIPPTMASPPRSTARHVRSDARRRSPRTQGAGTGRSLGRAQGRGRAGGGGRPRGIAVDIARQVAATARPGEVAVSGAVKAIVAGSGIEFEERGDRQLEGVPGTRRLYAAQI
jgi:hypothetical protein